MEQVNIKDMYSDMIRFASYGDKDWVYIIMGRPGPTGKTTLCKKLREHGYNAFELSEELAPFVDYRDDRNHYLMDRANKKMLIILNKPLNRDLKRVYRDKE